jgi:hypothetical protein
MSNFSQTTNPVHIQQTTKLSKAQLKHIKVFARDVNQTPEYRVNRIKDYIGNSVRAIVNNGDHINIVTNGSPMGDLSTQYFINIPNQIINS